MLNFKFEKSETDKRQEYDLKLRERGYISAGSYRSDTQHEYTRVPKSACEEDRGPDKTVYLVEDKTNKIIFTWDRILGGYYVSMSGKQATAITLEILKEIKYDVRPFET
jgi:hypothetical protein